MKRISMLIVALLAPAAVHAQGGPGTAGAGVLQLMAGSRAPALSGAYVAWAGDADALFYNPAGAAGVSAAASMAYQRHVADIGMFSGGGAFRVGRVVVGGSLLVLDYGEIDVIEPDPDFGGQTGRPTGERVSASETAARVTVAMPIGARMRAGISLGNLRVDLAGGARSTRMFDAGLQYELPRVAFGAALRNLGSGLSGSGLADAPLPGEFRFGATTQVMGRGALGARITADFVAAFKGGGTGLVAGVEAGLLPDPASRFGAVARLGYDGGTGDGGIGALRFGGGLSAGPFALDYTYQDFDLFGTTHRFGVRWTRLP